MLVSVTTSYEIVQARIKSTGIIVTIKLYKDIFKNIYETKKIIREIQILRQLTQMENN